MTIGLRSLAGSNQFEIRLDPKDLGRIDVNLDIDKETGAVQARLVVDRPETLALLQRDASNLQQALAQAGLNPGEGSINLSLRGDGQQDGRSNGSGGDGQQSDTGRSARADNPDPTPIAAVPMRRYGALSGIDIRI
ncbi:flagellar hook-length control protein FliK [Methylobacterium goesingense]|nr:flagellar hook-length control protein FliK [Methylobacterium goesingense]